MAKIPESKVTVTFDQRSMKALERVASALEKQNRMLAEELHPIVKEDQDAERA